MLTTATAIVALTASPAAAFNSTPTHHCVVMGDDGVRQGVICADVYVVNHIEFAQLQAICQPKAGGSPIQCAGVRFDDGVYTNDPGTTVALAGPTTFTCGSFNSSMVPCPRPQDFDDGRFEETIGYGGIIGICLLIGDSWAAATSTSIRLPVSNKLVGGTNVASMHLFNQRVGNTC